MRYDEYEPLIAPARPTAGLMRLVIGIIMTALVCLLLGRTLWSILPALLSPEMHSAIIADVEVARSPATLLFNLYIFALLIASVIIVLRILHLRGLQSILGPPRLALTQFRRVTLALVLLFAISVLLPFPSDLTPERHLPFGQWCLLLPLSLFGILIQTSAEEIAFRGYIQSQLAARFSHPVIWIGGPSVLFGLLHYDPALPQHTAWIIVLWATLFGAAAADLTARSGTLGPAIALHMVNNFSAILIAAPKGNFDGLALYTFPFSLETADALTAWAPVDLMILLCSWLAARLALRR